MFWCVNAITYNETSDVKGPGIFPSQIFWLSVNKNCTVNCMEKIKGT